MMLVLLGIRNSIKTDLDAAPTQLVFGQELRLPCDFVDPAPREPLDAGDFARTLARGMRQLRPTQTRRSERNVYVPTELHTCSHVFLRVDSVRPSMKPPYTGPYRVVSRSNKTMTIESGGQKQTVSLDRVKPAFILEDDREPQSRVTPSHISTPVVHREPSPSESRVASHDTSIRNDVPIPSETTLHGSPSVTTTPFTAAPEVLQPTRSGRFRWRPRYLSDYCDVP